MYFKDMFDIQRSNTPLNIVEIQLVGYIQSLHFKDELVKRFTCILVLLP